MSCNGAEPTPNCIHLHSEKIDSELLLGSIVPFPGSNRHVDVSVVVFSGYTVGGEALSLGEVSAEPVYEALA